MGLKEGGGDDVEGEAMMIMMIMMDTEGMGMVGGGEEAVFWGD